MDHCNGGRIKTNAYSKIWEQVNLLEGSKPICCKWVYKTKKDSEGKTTKQDLLLKD